MRRCGEEGWRDEKVWSRLAEGGSNGGVEINEVRIGKNRRAKRAREGRRRGGGRTTGTDRFRRGDGTKVEGIERATSVS